MNSVPEMFNFLNFERDGTITMHEFKRLLKNTFGVTREGRISEGYINILAQRYKVAGVTHRSEPEADCY